MELEGSLPHSQEPDTCPFPGPGRASPWPLPTSRRSILILSSHIRLGLSGGLLSLGFPTKTLYMPLSLITPTCPSHFILDFFDPNNIGWGVDIIQLLILYFSPLPCYLVPLRPKYSPQHPILKHPQPTFLPQCVPLSCTPIQKAKHIVQKLI